MTDTTTVVLASSNKGKIAELQAMLAGVAKVISGGELNVIMPEETGTTFAENAMLKAVSVHEQTGLTVVADDSGLIVDALKGAPGVYSARFAGEDATDEQNNEKLLEEMKDVSEADRTARFWSAIAIVTAAGEQMLFEGSCEGAVGYAPRGSNGFGYDPLFVFPSGETMAERDSAAKNQISHRGNAMRLAVPALRTYLESTS